MSNKNIAETDYFRIEEDNDGIIHVKFFSRDYLNFEDVKDYIEKVFPIASKMPKKKVIVDVREIENLTPNAGKHFFSEKINNSTLAAAIVMKKASPIVSIGTSIMLKMQNIPFPVKLFTTEEEALNWLREIKV